MCSHCKAFFNDTQSLFEHKKVHKVEMVHFGNTEEALCPTESTIGETCESEMDFPAPKNKRTRMKYRGMYLIINELSIHRVMCQVLGTSNKVGTGNRTRCEVCDWTDSDNELLQYIKHPNISYRCSECNCKFREYILLCFLSSLYSVSDNQCISCCSFCSGVNVSNAHLVKAL